MFSSGSNCYEGVRFFDNGTHRRVAKSSQLNSSGSLSNKFKCCSRGWLNCTCCFY